MANPPWEAVIQTLSNSVQQVLEIQAQNSQYQSELARQLVENNAGTGTSGASSGQGRRTKESSRLRVLPEHYHYSHKSSESFIEHKM